MAEAGSGSGSARALLEAQRAAFVREGPVSEATRRRRIQGAINLLVKHCDALCEAMREDFGGRPEVFSLLNDILGSLGSLKATRESFAAWMADERCTPLPPYDQYGAKAWVRHEPKGVVGIIGTWNAPLYTLFAPLASVYAAGNRAVLKPSEVTPRTAEVLAQAVRADCDPAELAVVTGGPDVGADFSAQPWDHLVFTGSTAVGKLIMRAASANLVPVTLELGGKSPVIVGRSADIADVAERVAVGKAQNSGQLCLAPDTLWAPAAEADALIAAMGKVYAGLYPRIGGNPDVVPVVNAKHYARVEGYVADAKARGARVVDVGGSHEQPGPDRRAPVRVVIDPPPDSEIAQHEIFGPALMLRTYRALEDAVAAINAGPRPLGLYFFGKDEAEQQYVLDHTLSGGVSINDVLMHAAVYDAPFGGVGASGMGHYHGREGFLEFSHSRTVYRAGGHDPRREQGMLPPYSDAFKQAVRSFVTP